MCVLVFLCVSELKNHHKWMLLVTDGERDVLPMRLWIHVCESMCVFVTIIPSSGVLRLDLKSLSSPLSLRRLSAQPRGIQALTVTMYRVEGVRPDNTPGKEENMSEKEWGSGHRQKDTWRRWEKEWEVITRVFHRGDIQFIVGRAPMALRLRQRAWTA